MYTPVPTVRVEKCGACGNDGLMRRWARRCEICEAQRRAEHQERRLRQAKRCAQCGGSTRSRNSQVCRACAGPWELAQRRAIHAVHAAIRAGHMPRAKDCVCADCGAPGFGYDHCDYSKPLEVDVVCGRCNQLRGSAKPVEPNLWRLMERRHAVLKIKWRARSREWRAVMRAEHPIPAEKAAA